MGLTEERIREQHRYIDELNEKLKPFKIFKSIECDILGDGALDYSNNVLSTFDLVIRFGAFEFEDDGRKSNDAVTERHSQPIHYNSGSYDGPVIA